MSKFGELAKLCIDRYAKKSGAKVDETKMKKMAPVFPVLDMVLDSFECDTPVCRINNDGSEIACGFGDSSYIVGRWSDELEAICRLAKRVEMKPSSIGGALFLFVFDGVFCRE